MSDEQTQSLVALVEIDSDNWRDACALRVQDEQADFVASVDHYLALCTYGEAGWSPLGIAVEGVIVGFSMWAIDEADDSFWIGGLLVDADQQGHGYGRAALESLVAMAAEGGRSGAALSYQPSNPARSLYADVGFEETGELEHDEVVARISL